MIISYYSYSYVCVPSVVNVKLNITLVFKSSAAIEIHEISKLFTSGIAVKY